MTADQDFATSLPFVPLMTAEAFSKLIGLELTVLEAQINRGYWPILKIGKRRFVNVEAVRISAAARASEFAL